MMRLLRLSAALALSALLAVNAQAAPPLRVAIGPEPDTLDPHRGTSLGTARLLLDLCEGLLTRDADGRAILGMAARRDVSADGLTHVFHLRADARWWNGEPVTASDFVRGWRRAVDPGAKSPIADLMDVFENAREIRLGTLPPDRLGVQAADAQTLVVRLARPTSDLDLVLSHRISLPVHGPTLQAKGADFAAPANLMCNGPYRLLEHRLQDRYSLIHNPSYYAPVGADRVDMMIVDQAEAELTRFRAGELDITSTVPTTMVEWARANMPGNLHIYPWTALAYLQVNPAGPWRDNPALLEALALALDREQLTVSSQGRAVPADRLVPPELWAFPVAATDGPSADTRRQAARDALARAGFGDGRSPPRIELMHASTDVVRRRVVAIAAQWKQVLGIDTDLVAVEARLVTANIKQGTYKGFVLNTWISYSPFYALAPFLPPDARINATDSRAQETEIRALEQALLDSHQVIPIAFASSLHMVAPRVTGWKDNVSDIHPARLLGLSPSP